MVLVSTTGGSKGMIMDTAARSPEAVRRARRGVLMSEALAEPDAGRQVDLDGGQRLQWHSGARFDLQPATGSRSAGTGYLGLVITIA